MPLLERNGLTFHTQRLGVTGPPLVMLHGLLVGSMTTWYFGAAPRLAKTHRVLLYDLRGHGKSERAARGYGLDDMVGDLDALAAELGDGEKLTLIGHSYGALTALAFALRWPARVARLVIVEAPLPPSQVGEFGAIAKRGPDEIMKTMPPILAGAVERGGRAAEKLLAQVQFLVLGSTLFDDLARETAWNLSGAAGAGLRARLETLAGIPVLCVYGESSSCRASGEALARAIPGATLRVLPGGHFLPVEAPHLVADELVRFCGG